MSVEQFTILSVAAACVAIVGAFGYLLIHLLRHRSLATLLTTMSCTSLGAVGLAVAVDARIMFLSPHDTLVIGLALATAIPLAVGLAWGFALRLRKSTRILGHYARNLGRVSTELPEKSMLSRELIHVQRDLESAGAEVRAARAQERAVEASRRELISGISHDLRTPLAGIRAMAEALVDGVAADPDKYHRQLQIEAERLSQLIDSLFLLSRLHASSLPFRPMEIDLFDVVADARSGFQPLAQARNIEIALFPENAPGPLVAVVDPQHLARALGNVLSNAIANTPHSGRISLQLEAVGPQAQIAVMDECGGIPEADLARLFDVAWRGDPARQRGPSGGGGLGLSIARGLVAAQGGQNTVENCGPGCRFTIILPLVG
ncbi:MAG: sensor histidine kinase [Angustibacter sp.]